jgi:hypothetical protein
MPHHGRLARGLSHREQSRRLDLQEPRGKPCSEQAAAGARWTVQQQRLGKLAALQHRAQPLAERVEPGAKAYIIFHINTLLRIS